MRVVLPLSLLAIPLLAGCMMPRPWRLPATTNCQESASPPVESTLFLTLRLPDCRTGILTRYRGDKLRFAAATGKGRPTLYREKAWFDDLARRVSAQNESAPILFIHGYNNTNEEVIERSDRLVGAMGGRRTVIALTWPSYGKKTGYFWDEANAEWALDHASAAVAQIVQKYPATVIVAHSMGSRLALRAVADLNRSGHLGKVPRLILAAPDIDREALVNAWKPPNAPPLDVTMYVSRRDQPLSASWRGHAYPRAGDFSWWVTGRQPHYAFSEVQRLQVVDTTDIDGTSLGHSAFIDVTEGAIDLCRVILSPTANRAVVNIGANYYRIVGKGPDDDCRRFSESG
jgi:pimeloyl-ACP methyl ester carboxylesterase